MQQVIKLLIGGLVLLLGFPIGSYLAKQTKEELKSGQKWFKLIIVVSLIGGGVGLIFGNDVILFSFFFIAVVTSQGLKKK